MNNSYIKIYFTYVAVYREIICWEYFQSTVIQCQCSFSFKLQSKNRQSIRGVYT